jgi:hypothetical protein
MSLSRAAAAMSVSPNSVDLHEDALDVSKSLVFNSAAALALTACFAFACSVMLSAFSQRGVRRLHGETGAGLDLDVGLSRHRNFGRAIDGDFRACRAGSNRCYVLDRLTFDISWLFGTSEYHTIWATGTKQASIAINR